MEKYQNIQKKTRIGLTLSTIFVLFSMVIAIINLCANLSADTIRYNVVAFSVVNIILCVLVAYYTIKGYKKPHGNMLKAVFIIYGFAVVIKAVITGSSSALIVISSILSCSSALIIAYVAGRLNRIEKNKTLLAITAILQIIRSIMQLIGGVPSFRVALGRIEGLFVLFALFAAYFARYEEHKEAGLADAPKTE